MYVFKNNIRIKITYDLHLITDGLAPGKFPSCTPWNIGCWKGSWCLSSFLGKAPLINLVLVLPFFISLSLKCNEHSTLLTFRTKDSLPTNSTHFFLYSSSFGNRKREMSSLFVCPHFSQSLPDILNIKNILELTTPKFSCVHSLYYHELCNTLYQRGVTWGKTIVSNSVPLKLDYTQYPFLKKPSHKKIFWFFILYIILGWFAP